MPVTPSLGQEALRQTSMCHVPTDTVVSIHSGRQGKEAVAAASTAGCGDVQVQLYKLLAEVGIAEHHKGRTAAEAPARDPSTSS